MTAYFPVWKLTNNALPTATTSTSASSTRKIARKVAAQNIDATVICSVRVIRSRDARVDLPDPVVTSAALARCAPRFIDWRITVKTGSFASAVLLLSALALVGCASPPPPKHPAYLHALTDLRDARWNLEHLPGDTAVYENEDVA